MCKFSSLPKLNTYMPMLILVDTCTCTCTCACTCTCMQALSDFDKVNLIKQASLRNYFTSHQVKSLLDVVSYRKGKLEVAVCIECRGS